MPTATAVKTATVGQRRHLHFDTIEQAIADVDILAAAERAAKLRHLGNWTFGQTLGHLATWVDYSFTGIPLKIPFFLRWMLRPLKNRIVYKPMSPGRNIPRVPGGTLATDAMSSEDGLAHFRRAFARLSTEPPTLPHTIFGPLTHDQWINLNLRHAELHLSFFTISQGV